MENLRIHQKKKPQFESSESELSSDSVVSSSSSSSS